jgi:hypothetical protein
VQVGVQKSEAQLRELTKATLWEVHTPAQEPVVRRKRNFQLTLSQSKQTPVRYEQAERCENSEVCRMESFSNSPQQGNTVYSYDRYVPRTYLFCGLLLWTSQALRRSITLPWYFNHGSM